MIPMLPYQNKTKQKNFQHLHYSLIFIYYKINNDFTIKKTLNPKQRFYFFYKKI